MTNVERALVALATAAIQNNGNICQQFATIDATGLRNLRKKYGLTQAEFSEKFGIPISTLRKWEQGVQKPSTTAMSFLHKIAEAEPA